uniref:Putative secreted protein n=1 Tax=Anopheles triannulatus TaxID=58253 RepID=A0A2M4B716_9DIPT
MKRRWSMICIAARPAMATTTTKGQHHWEGARNGVGCLHPEVGGWMGWSDVSATLVHSAHHSLHRERERELDHAMPALLRVAVAVRSLAARCIDAA